ncbi:NepR family anti-sigma factor [Pararhodobacter zhoushanensis]|uniref:NepR family anti-sigma factor n=1 Tax=Pararhodobacter zhoushanensis TaxID=2479545 RepID=A0ABT3H3S6_9RHOB|nr:NepR family anti-sigma factor [Pararhodobacter zhoushanensis]MCW1934481.1 NepR family anti-sigma factor [Pararhodobacter zhoushanensis]
MDQETNQHDIEDQISENLRRAFKERADEKVPDRFLDLLRQLRDQDGEHMNGQ